MKAKRKATDPDTPTLTFRGLDLCDGCGTRLELEDQLWRLYPSCHGTHEGEPTAPFGPKLGRSFDT